MKTTVLPALLLIGALLAGCSFQTHDPSTPANPTTSPTRTSDVDPDDPMLKVDWFAATITGALPNCGFGTSERALIFHRDGGWAMIGARWRRPSVGFGPRYVAYGDLTGDGKAEAIISAACASGDEGWPASWAGTWIVRRDDAGDLHIIDIVWLGTPIRIDNGLLLLQPSSWDSDRGLGRVLALAWDGAAMVPVNTGDRFPPVKTLDLSGIAAQLPCGGLAPRNPGTLSFDSQLTAADGDRQWRLRYWEEEWADLGRDGKPYLLTDVFCRPLNEPEWMGPKGRKLVLLDRTPDAWTVVALLDPGQDGWSLGSINGRVVTISLRVQISPSEPVKSVPVDYLWDGVKFSRLG
jgi:hypothetical protein